MTLTLGFVLLMLIGTALIVGAFNSKKLITWENRSLTSLADALQHYREDLEAEQLLLETAAPLHEPLPLHPAPTQTRRHGNRAA